MDAGNYLSYSNSSSLQVFGVVITLAATVALLLLCGWCRKKKNDGAPSTEKVEPMLVCLPSVPCYPEQIEAKQLILMVIPDYNAAIFIPTLVSSPLTAFLPSMVSPP
ncbi:hypothetical protein T10_8346 [Trichinella papuae]|uniref:Uncharacterized protein n=1 Tax=Trichinella papuae TaxID=268474 RepID=A0A0V1N7W8_9BILA|nr:hypothetical protein T10_8346 [Trichinella papuae]